MRALVALLLLAPLAAGQAGVGGAAPPPEETGYAGGPIVVPLHMHVYDLLQPVPMNTQPMVDVDLGRGFGSPSVTGAGPADTPHSLRLYGSPGLVEYNLTERDGLPRHHPERGISYDVLLDPARPLVGHFFLGVKAADVPQLGQTGGPEAGVAPSLTVRMTMRAGDDIGADLDTGDLIAVGQTTLGPEAWAVNGAPVEFVVDMGTPLTDRIPGDASFNVKVEWFNAETPDGRQVVQRDWVVHTGARHPNRVEVGVLNPLAVYSVRPTPVGDERLTIHAVANSPFGNYDVDVANATIAIVGPSQPRAMAPPLVIQRSFEHNHHYEPVELTWVWDYRAERAAPGGYQVSITVQNLQKTAVATKTATFTIPEEGRVVGVDDTGAVVAPEGVAAAQETPGPGLALLALIVAGAAFASRSGRPHPRPRRHEDAK